MTCGAGLGAGFAVDYALADAPDLVRLFAVGGSALGVIALLLATWQKITPRSIAASMKDKKPEDQSLLPTRSTVDDAP